jgi:hypothetical protein
MGGDCSREAVDAQCDEETGDYLHVIAEVLDIDE